MSAAADPNDCDYIYKFILIGKYGVGKSTLMKTAVQSTDQAEVAAMKEVVEEEPPFVGVDYRSVRMKVDGKIVDVKIFDPNDMEKYRVAADWTDHYYKNAHVALLVYDIMDSTSFKSLQEEWLVDAKRYCSNDCVKVAVANKIDSASKHAYNRVDFKKWADSESLLYKEVSAIDPDSVNELLTGLVRCRLESEHTPDSPSAPSAPASELWSCCCIV